MIPRLAWSWSCALFALVVAACGGGDDDGDPADADAGPPDPGALISVSLDSTVGVVLEDVPAALRDEAATQTLALPDSFWIERAKRQIDHTWQRLAYRRLYALLEGEWKSQLPLPPREDWKVVLDSAGPQRQEFDGHDVIAVDYSMTTTILTDVASIELAEPELAEVGGHWDEHFVFPLDPELVFQRTGYACLHETPDVPQTFLDGENAYYFYDFDCLDHNFPDLNCHLTTGTWPLDCNEALKMYVGRVDTAFKLDRLTWDEGMADSVRNVDPAAGIDLEANVAGVENNRLMYRYIPEGDCTLLEGCVAAPGWRRLLLFDASLINRGDEALNYGDPDDLAAHNVFEFSECHDHKHFLGYGDFTVTADATVLDTDLDAFCLQSTRRYSNNEASPLATPYDKCELQGIGAGWGADNGAGLDCQWVDVTDFDYSGGAVDAELAWTANPDSYLCEGEPMVDDNGNYVFEPSEFETEDGDTIDRVVCNGGDGFDANNTAATEVTLPARGGLVTTPCKPGIYGPKRDCGFTEDPTPVACTPGAEVTVSCTVADGSEPQLLRLCETSAVLGTGIACIHRYALASGVVADAPTEVTFTCPAARDANEPGGEFAIYSAPALDDVAEQTVTCVVE